MLWLVAIIFIVGALAMLWLLSAAVLEPLSLLRFFQAQGVQGLPWKPIVGDVPWIIKNHKNETEPAVHPWMECHRTYGKVMSFFFGPGFRLRIIDATATQEILVRRADAFRKPVIVSSLLSPLLGSKGMLLAEGACHKHQRLAAKGAFEFAGLQAMTPLLHAVTASTLVYWTQSLVRDEDGWVDVPNFSPLISSLTLAISAVLRFRRWRPPLPLLPLVVMPASLRSLRCL
jgi:hypothetical protein